MDAGVDINKNDYSHPLFKAIRQGDPSILKILIDAGADLNIPDCDKGNTPLWFAGYKSYELSMQLVDAGANVNSVNFFGTPVISSACMTGNIKTAKLLIDAGADINASNGDIGSPLKISIRNNQIAIIELLLDAGANVNAITASGMTPLYHVIFENNLLDIDKKIKKKDLHSIIKLLISSGADIVAALTRGNIRFNRPARKGERAILKLLAENGIDATQISICEDSPLHQACKAGNISLVKANIAADTNVNISSQEGAPLHLACAHGHTSIVKQLIKAGANVNAACWDGTPLFLACGSDKVSIVRMLLKAGANIHVQCHQKNRA